MIVAVFHASTFHMEKKNNENTTQISLFATK